MARNLQDELQWLLEPGHEAFEQRPATFREFIGPEYLNIEKYLRKRIVDELEVILGTEVNVDKIAQYAEALITGAIGIGKTTVASVVLPYMVHWVLCLKDPQDYFDLLPGSRIAFMLMSTSEQQAREVVFADVKARVQHSAWFKNQAPPDPTFKNQLRFGKDIWIVPGDSRETTFEGYNILGGILDEGDSHLVTTKRDYAEEGYTTISSRITSRFQDRGFLLIIGQRKSASGFMERKYRAFLARPDAYAVSLTIWDSMGEEFYANRDGGKTFGYDTLRRQILPSGVVDLLNRPSVMKIPWLYRQQFMEDPIKALRDLAGIPPKVGNPFIPLVDKIIDCEDRWITRFGPESPVDPDGRIPTWFRAKDKLKRVGHLDIAFAADGDALGFAMGHVREVVEIDGEAKPVIIIDLALRLSAPTGGEIILSDVRQIIYALKNERGFRLVKMTMDGFQSTDTKQQFRRKGIDVEEVSCDKSLVPYSDLREAIYEGRIEFPPYIANIRKDLGRVEPTKIIIQELSELVDMDRKVDHPEPGSKDVADAIAGVTFTLMGSRQYRRNVPDLSIARKQREERSALAAVGASRPSHPAVLGNSGITAPLPPAWRRPS
jgi:hypothetical protein